MQSNLNITHSKSFDRPVKILVNFYQGINTIQHLLMSEGNFYVGHSKYSVGQWNVKYKQSVS